MGWRSTKPVQTEAEVERKFVSLVKERGALCYKFVSPGNPGVPDRILILPNGQVMFVEMKSAVGRTKKLQDYQLEKLNRQGVPTFVLRGMDDVKKFIDEIFGKETR